jgi:hypothetical protein
VAVHDSRGSLRRLEGLAEPSRVTVPHGLLLCSGSYGARGNHDHDSELMGRRAAGVMGVVGIVSAIPEPMERRTYRMCGVIRFCAAIFLGGCGDHVHDSRTDEMPHIWDVPGNPFLRRHFPWAITSESNAN